jgi:hypothetical protein
VFGTTAAGPRITHRDGASGAVDARDLGLGLHLDVEARVEHVLGGHEQGAFVRDDGPHILRQPAVRKRHVGAPLEHDNLDGLVESL